MRSTLAGAGFAAVCWLPALVGVIAQDGMTLAKGAALAGGAMVVGAWLAIGRSAGVITREPRRLLF